ncbi:hemerythrin domain-containing protein [Desulfogranum mediterraneum]|uniref:hemerythrin domain-containing protein n=1 Tax=Desulfogranum mediterraneum TaxID=160661 RepID=UPI000407B263|nr:hemerythrin domain-containing protein [Desulfogranum mediterraneum]
MWYSIYTVGDIDIDQEHANIDFMLSALPKERSALRDALYPLIDVIIQHFSHEEEIAATQGYSMSGSHRARHRELTRHLEVIKAGLGRAETDLQEIPRELQNMLKLHILDFDRFLLSS